MLRLSEDWASSFFSQPVETSRGGLGSVAVLGACAQTFGRRSGDCCILLQAEKRKSKSRVKPLHIPTEPQWRPYDQTITDRVCGSFRKQPCRARHRTRADVQG